MVKGGNTLKKFVTYLAVIACFVVFVPQAFAQQAGSRPGNHLSHLQSTFPDGH